MKLESGCGRRKAEGGNWLEGENAQKAENGKGWKAQNVQNTEGGRKPAEVEMSLNSTPSGERIHIGFFGKRNAGKSSVVNAVTGQNLAIVSDVKGTTTDPVCKAMELLPLGPVMIIDTPGIDDEGELGRLRVKKSYQVINKTDFAVLVVDSTVGMGPEEEALIERLKQKNIRYVIVYNKSDLSAGHTAGEENKPAAHIAAKGENEPSANTCEENQLTIHVSAKTGERIGELKELIARNAVTEEPQLPIVSDLISPGDFVVLVIPIDKAAPKGRLILPQQQTIRDILDAGGVSIAVKEDGLVKTLSELGKRPALVITDSQAFAQVSKDVPEEIPLTSFSILMARHKGDLEITAAGTAAVEGLEDGDAVLISEGCTHHRQCDDIGTVKLPSWIRKHTGKQPAFEFSSGTEFPDDLTKYKLIVHCGGCMLNRREMQYRLACAADQGVPITNYGMLIAYMNGILPRSMAPLKR